MNPSLRTSLGTRMCSPFQDLAIDEATPCCDLATTTKGTLQSLPLETERSSNREDSRRQNVGDISVTRAKGLVGSGHRVCIRDVERVELTLEPVLADLKPFGHPDIAVVEPRQIGRPRLQQADDDRGLRQRLSGQRPESGRTDVVVLVQRGIAAILSRPAAGTALEGHAQRDS